MRPKLILVCGPWGSGTSVVAGVVMRLGGKGYGPFFRTSDERTPNSFELAPFRDTILSLASEETLALKPGAEKLAAASLEAFKDRLMRGEFGAYNPDAPIVLKCPLSALLIPEICAAFDTRLIYVVRPIQEIENSRIRRQWTPQLGAAGANLIYTRMFGLYIDHTFPTLFLRYRELLANASFEIDRIAAFCELRPHDAMREVARDLVRTT